MLPIAFLGEQEEPMERYGAPACIAAGYRDIFTTGIWMYSIYTFNQLVRKALGIHTANAVWTCQQNFLSQEVDGARQAYGKVFGLIHDAAWLGDIKVATHWGEIAAPVELNVALTLLLNLPESPDYTPDATASRTQTRRMKGDVDWVFANCLSRSREQIDTVFADLFKAA